MLMEFVLGPKLFVERTRFHARAKDTISLSKLEEVW